MILVFLGPPGSGKGTQAKRLASQKNWPQLSTGDMLRAAIQNGTQLGHEAKAFMDKGALVPDEVVIGLISERIQASDCRGGFILDGFPRTIPQAEALDLMLTSQSRKIDRSIQFVIEDEDLVKRLSGRRICKACGAMYHVDFMLPKKHGVCDQCSSSDIVQRDDDKPEVIHKRLEVYHRQTAPLVSYYSMTGKLRSIDASLSQEQVEASLKQALQQ